MSSCKMHNKYNIPHYYSDKIKDMKEKRNKNKVNGYRLSYNKTLYYFTKKNDFDNVIHILSNGSPLDNQINNKLSVIGGNINRENCNCYFDNEHEHYIHSHNDKLRDKDVPFYINQNKCLLNKYYSNHTPLSYACFKGYNNIVYALLELGACPNQRFYKKKSSKEYKTLMHFAIDIENYTLIHMLIDYGYKDKFNIIEYIIKSKIALEIFILIYENMKDESDIFGNVKGTILSCSCKYNNLTILRYAISNNIIDKEMLQKSNIFYSILEPNINKYNINTIKFLLDCGMPSYKRIINGLDTFMIEPQYIIGRDIGIYQQKKYKYETIVKMLLLHGCQISDVYQYLDYIKDIHSKLRWSPETHHLFPKIIQNKIRNTIIMYSKLKLFERVPLELLYEIINKMVDECLILNIYVDEHYGLDTNLHMYARNYNFLRILSNLGSLAYAN